MFFVCLFVELRQNTGSCILSFSSYCQLLIFIIFEPNRNVYLLCPFFFFLGKSDYLKEVQISLASHFYLVFLLYSLNPNLAIVTPKLLNAIENILVSKMFFQEQRVVSYLLPSYISVHVSEVVAMPPCLHHMRNSKRNFTEVLFTRCYLAEVNSRSSFVSLCVWTIVLAIK